MLKLVYWKRGIILYCSKCDRKITGVLKFWKYCPYCGAEIPRGIPESPAADNTSLKKLFIIIAACILLIAVVLVVGITSRNQAALTKQEAQEKIDAALASVFQEASSDNFIVQALEKTANIRVDSVKQTNNGIFANCTATSLDLATPILEYIQTLDASRVDSYANVIIELTAAISDAPETQKDFQIEFIQVDNEYQPAFSEELVEFCSGNIHELLPKLYTILQGGGIA